MTEMLSMMLAKGLWSQWILPFASFFLGLGVVVCIHEFGHFIVAKMVGIRVERFAFGFGPRLFGIKKGETDYCVNLLPLGGYVKMLGQEDFAPLKGDEQRDPRSFAAKSVGQRFAVISAGVIMNVIGAAIGFIIVGLAGLQQPAPVVGGAVEGFPADTATITWQGQAPPVPAGATQASATQPYEWKGLKAGDTIVAINGDPITRFRQLSLQAAFADRGDQFEVTFIRTIGDKQYTGTAQMQVIEGPSPSGEGMLMFGIERPRSVVFGPVPEGQSSPFEEGDRVVAVNGVPIQNYWDIQEIQKGLLKPAVPVTVRRTVDGQTTTITHELTPSLRGGDLPDAVWTEDTGWVFGQISSQTTQEVTILVEDPVGKQQRTFAIAETGRDKAELLEVLGMVPRLTVSRLTDPDAPASQAGLQPGDIILEYGQQRSPTYRQLREITQDNVGQATPITVLRDDGEGNLKQVSTTITPGELNDVALIGIYAGTDTDHLVVAGLLPDSPAAAAGIPEGATIQTVNGQPVDSWFALLQALESTEADSVELGYQHGTVSETVSVPLNDETFDAGAYRANIFADVQGFQELMGEEVRRGPLQAVAWGVGETWDLIRITYLTISSYFKGNISWREMSGPVGIGHAAIVAARQGWVHFVYLMAIISVSLAVVNFLPIPVVDGGHAVFLIIEKIIRRPVPVKVMNIFQMLGLAMILFAFVALTWKDITQLWESFW